MVLFPNAKINIGLDVLNRRPDGYHNLSTIMMPTGWCDILEITPRANDGGNDALILSGRPVDCPPEKNLVMKAVAAMRDVAEFPVVEVRLHKVIPDGAGLGGGSADAAFTLKGLNTLFHLGLSDDALVSIAATLGADCAFFIHNKPMLCEGIGDRLTPVDLSMLVGLQLVIVKPPFGVSTSQAYSAVKPELPEVSIPQYLATLPVNRWHGSIKNDFEASVFPQFPEIARIKDALMAQGAVYASMSGSGSAVYGFFPADSDLTHIPKQFPKCEVFVDAVKF